MSEEQFEIVKIDEDWVFDEESGTLIAKKPAVEYLIRKKAE